MKIRFDFEGRDEECAFFALYAGLRMYKERKDEQAKAFCAKIRKPVEMFSISAAEAFSMLEDLKENFPSHFIEAEKEYNKVYGK